MTDSAVPEQHDELMEGLRAADDALAGAPNAPTSDLGGIRASLDRIERATPAGAGLHAQLDTVRKWLDVLGRPSEHHRFGGEAHIRDHVRTQLRLVRGALEDYRRTMPDAS
jgi:hypothetical protein